MKRLLLALLLCVSPVFAATAPTRLVSGIEWWDEDPLIQQWEIQQIYFTGTAWMPAKTVLTTTVCGLRVFPHFGSSGAARHCFWSPAAGLPVNAFFRIRPWAPTPTAAASIEAGVSPPLAPREWQELPHVEIVCATKTKPFNFPATASIGEAWRIFPGVPSGRCP